MYKTSIVFRKKAFVLLLLAILILIALFLISVWVLKLKVLGILLLAAIITFILFLNTLLKRFTRRVIVNFSNETFSVQIVKPNDSKIEIGDSYELNDLVSYGISFPNRKYVDLRLTLRDGKKIQYSFSTNQIDEDQTEPMVIMDKFHDLITIYNKNNSKDNQIECQPSFYATKSGLVTLICLAICFITAIIIHIIYDLKTFPVTLVVGFVLIFQVIMKRKIELAYFKRMK